MCKYLVLIIAVLAATYDVARCDPISNTNFNSHIRDYSVSDVNNTTNVKTLQKEDTEKYVTFTPAGKPIKFKEIPDSALSSSSNGRGLLYHDHPGYTVNDYEDGPHYPHGHDYHLYEPHPEVHGPPTFDHGHHGYHHNDHHDHHDPYNHHDYHDLHDNGHHYPGHHHSEHGHYNKHYKHALAAKTVLWPIAGIALLGAAAALVSNPVLLQLGVVSGKRRRRDTEEITGPDFTDTFKKYEDKMKVPSKENQTFRAKENLRKRTKQNRNLKITSFTENSKRKLLKVDNLDGVRHNIGVKKTHSSVKRNIDEVITNQANKNDDDGFIPIPIKLRTPNVTE